MEKATAVTGSSTNDAHLAHQELNSRLIERQRGLVLLIENLIQVL
jgi:hypothetical protein